MEQLAALPPAEANSSGTAAKWAALDLAFAKQAATVPYYNGLLTSFFSPRMNMSCDVIDDNYDDFAQFCTK
jgi:hypothetical protein